MTKVQLTVELDIDYPDCIICLQKWLLKGHSKKMELDCLEGDCDKQEIYDFVLIEK